jgi:DNA replication protein DnaC
MNQITEYENKLRQIKDYAKYLKLAYSHNNAKEFIDEHIAEGTAVDACYVDLLKRESAVRQEHSKQSRIRTANFPYKKYIADLQVEFLPDDAKEKLGILKTLEFIRNKQNVILAGNPGTGKTHIAIGLGILACLDGFKVLFCNAPNLINRLKEARSERTLLTLQRQFETYDLVIIDELGYISFDKEGGELLFTHLSLRAERKSTIITTNLSFEKWNEIFNDPVMTTAIIDRGTHKALAVNMNGNSYRLRETQRLLARKK